MKMVNSVVKKFNSNLMGIKVQY